MTDNDYMIGWGLYAFAALGCLLVWMKLTGWMWRYLREPLWLIGALLLFSPTLIDPVKEKYAPALAISVLDLAFKVGNNVWRAVLDLATYSAVAFGLYVVFALIRLPILKAHKARQAHAQAAADAQAAEQKNQQDELFASPNAGRYATQPVVPAASEGPATGTGNRFRVEPKL
jgi:pyruvate/2-oxoglutarate dehydrogenase complex dihydrolipoamide acyltransferase (E2) component